MEESKPNQDLVDATVQHYLTLSGRLPVPPEMNSNNDSYEHTVRAATYDVLVEQGINPLRHRQLFIDLARAAELGLKRKPPTLRRAKRGQQQLDPKE